MTLDTARTTADSIADHLSDHNTLHGFYNGVDGGIVYVHPDGSDTNSGRSWTLAKATPGGAIAQASSTQRVPHVLCAPGSYDVDETLQPPDGMLIEGASQHGAQSGGGAYFGTIFQATASLGTDPMISMPGTMTAGGLRRFKMVGTDDDNGGVGFYTDQPVGDGWILDEIRVSDFTSHGYHFDHATTMGNPAVFRRVDAFDNGGDGVHIKAANFGTIHFYYLGGDDNAGALLKVESMSVRGRIRIDELKAERTEDGTQNNIVDITTSDNGKLSIGGFKVYHNVSGGTDGNALIHTGDAGLRFDVEHVFHYSPGSNVYTYGYEDSGTSVSFDDFVHRRWTYSDLSFGYKTAGDYTPTNVSTDRSYDADSTTTAELADVLGTLISDLQGIGVIG